MEERECAGLSHGAAMAMTHEDLVAALLTIQEENEALSKENASVKEELKRRTDDLVAEKKVLENDLENYKKWYYDTSSRLINCRKALDAVI